MKAPYHNYIANKLVVHNSGKTTLSLKICNEFLRSHDNGIVIYIDVEKTLEQAYLEALVDDLDRFIIGSPDTGEQVVDIVNQCAGQLVDMLLVVDSIAATVPMVEVDNSAEKQQMGVHARLINKLVRIANSRMKKNLTDPNAPTTTVLMLNQERMKIGVFGDPSTTPGGLGKNYFSSLRIKLFGSGAASNKIVEEVTIGKLARKKLLGRKLTYTIIKNKCGVEPFDNGEMHYYNVAHNNIPQYGFDNDTALFRWGVLTEVISFDSGEYVWVDSKANDLRYKSEKGFMTALRAKGDAEANLLYEEILEARRTKGIILDDSVEA